MGTAAPEKQADLSESDPNVDRPPRLATCINQRDVEPERSMYGDNTATLLAGRSLDAEDLSNILQWIVDLLEDDAGFDAVWETGAGQHPNPSELESDLNGADEESWAKLMEQLFLGAAYGGPEIVAQFPSKGTIKSGGYLYILNRFVSRSGDSISLEDPACPLVVSCQGLTTLGALGRGVTWSALGNIGIPASQGASALPIFKDAWYSPKPIIVGGQSVLEDSKHLSSEDAHNADKAFEKVRDSGQERTFGPGTIYTYNPLKFTEFIMVEVDSRDLKQGGNTLELDGIGLPEVDPARAAKRALEIQAGIKDIDKTLNALGMAVVDWAKKVGITTPPYVPIETPISEGAIGDAGWHPEVSEAEKNAIGLFTAWLPVVGIQLDGSHVSMVLRRYTTTDGKHKAVQMLDTSADIKPGAGAPKREEGMTAKAYENAVIARTENDYFTFEKVATYRGIYAGEGHTERKAANTGNFVGMGVLPPIANAQGVLESLRRTRPVGLARLVITNRVGGEIKEDDILFISPMVPMWGTHTPYQNYTVSRLLWSLRNVPYYASIQAFWIVYTPKGPLAEVMWELGARDLSLAEIALEAIDRANRYRPATAPEWKELKTARDLMCMAVLSHDVHGRAQELWRDHALKGGMGEGTLPKLIKELFVQTGAAAVSLITKKRDELMKLMNAAIAARVRQINALVERYKRAFNRAGQGDASAADEAKAIKEEIDALLNSSVQEVTDLWNWAALDLDTKSGPMVQIRANPFAAYVNYDALGFGVTVPGFLTGTE